MKKLLLYPKLKGALTRRRAKIFISYLRLTNFVLTFIFQLLIVCEVQFRFVYTLVTKYVHSRFTLLFTVFLEEAKKLFV